MRKIKFVIMLLALIGVQNVFALKCEGTIHVQLPSSWTSPNMLVSGLWVRLPATALQNGWYVLDALTIGDQLSENFIFAATDWYGPGVTTKDYNLSGGMDGWSQEDAFSCKDLASGDVYIYENPAAPGKTVVSANPPDAKYFFVMIPPEMDEWMSSVPMLSLDGGLTGKPMTAVEGMCGWYSYVFFNEMPTDNVVLYRDDDFDREDLIGVNGNWETSASAQPIPLSMIFAVGVDSLFFVPDEEQKTTADGLYYSAAEVEGIEGTCSYTLAAIIYDTDANLHPAFSCWSQGGEGCQGLSGTAAQGVDKTTAITAINACIGVIPGIVESTLDPSVPQSQRKPKLTSAGKKCFLDEKYFNQLFNYTQNVNEKSCFDMPFHRSRDGKWEFDSDFYTSPGLTARGGFYPVETSTDMTILAADPSQTPISAARTRRVAEGPVFYGPKLREMDPDEGVPLIDIACNGPGWNKGMKCDGLFSDGESTEAALRQFFKLSTSDCVIGWSCPQSAPSDWPYFESGTDIPVSSSNGSAEARWYSKSGRNQHFCFESHAKFTYKPGLKFSFRGDDDIWVFIDNQLAVDLGGTHLAAPGYVDLDSFTGLSGKLEIGNQYDLDIFFCDRRTTMSNVRIKTNMYIMQKTAIEARPTKTGTSEKSYDICYTKSGDGSCAAAMTGEEKEETYCGDQIWNAGLRITYTLVQGNLLTSPVVYGFDAVSTPGVYKCGIDLTNLTNPKVNPEKACLGGGRYTLFATIEGKTKKIASFRKSGEVDVVYANGVAKDTNGVPIRGGNYTLKNNAIAGELVPIYVSSVAAIEGQNGLEIFPDDAVGVQYTLSYDKLLTLYYKEADGSYVKVPSGQARTIGVSGIDTLYATVSMDDMISPIQSFNVSVTGRPNALTLSFYLAQITFIEKIPEEGTTAKAVSGLSPNADGTYEEYWSGSIYDLYLAVLIPNKDGSYSPCLTECDGLKIHKGAATSPKIDFIPEEVGFKNGYATISVRSQASYRWDMDPSLHNPATIVAEYNENVQAVYSPMYFRNPPVQYPVYAEVFDTRGSLPSMEFSIPEPYFSMSQEYLDGIGDSVAIYYDRPLHKDSLPTKICIMWDSAAATAHNPIEEGLSNIPKDTLITCNELVSVDFSNIDCSYPDALGYCTNLIKIGGLTLSTDVKTAGVGKIHSYAEFADKGKMIRQGFAGVLADRIAPVPLRAEIGSVSGFDSLVVIMSEPVKLVTASNKKSALDFYLNSAIDLSENSRFVSALANTSVMVVAQVEPTVGVNAKTGEGRVKYMYLRGNVSPHVGDYVRLAGNLSNVFWSDVDTISSMLPGIDTLRAAADAAYYWNSPTSYNETKRLPSPWVPITEVTVHEEEKGSEEGSEEGDVIYAKPSFRVRMVGPFQFAIVMDDDAPATLKSYAVMDLQGRVVNRGKITSSETLVPALNSGSYVVRVGLGMRRVNVR